MVLSWLSFSVAWFWLGMACVFVRTLIVCSFLLFVSFYSNWFSSCSNWFFSHSFVILVSSLILRFHWFFTCLLHLHSKTRRCSVLLVYVGSCSLFSLAQYSITSSTTSAVLCSLPSLLTSQLYSPVLLNATHSPGIVASFPAYFHATPNPVPIIVLNSFNPKGPCDVSSTTHQPTYSSRASGFSLHR